MFRFGGHHWVLHLMLILSMSTAFAGAVRAQSFHDRMFGSSGQDGRTTSTPTVARFESDDGDSFVLDQSSGQPLMRFDGDSEVWSLTVTQGPKGDLIYKNDVGQPVLKATRWGGMILFSAERPTGDPVAVAGKADALQPGRMSPALLWQTLARGSRRVSQAVGRLVPFDAPEVTPGADSLYAQAADVASNALVTLASQVKGHERLAPVHGVQFVEGRPPSATITDGVLVMKLDISRGSWGGHVSSKRIINVITASFTLADDR